MEDYTSLQVHVPAEVEKEATELATHMVSEISNDEQQTEYTDYLAKISDYLKTAESRRKELVKPLNDTVKKINDWFKQAVGPAVDLDQRIRRVLTDYHMKKQKAAQELQMQKVQESIQQGTAVEIIAQPETLVKAESGSANFRDNWKWELKDIKQVPVYYLTTNDAMITKAVKGGLREIPGIRIYNEPIVAVKGGSNEGS